MIWIQEICGLLPLTQEYDEHDCNKECMDEQAGDQFDHRQDLHLKYYFFYQVVVFLKASCSAV